MPFAPKFASVWNDYLKPIIQEVGLRPVRVDEKFSSSSIIMDILDGIASANLVLADLTGGNPNVFYEVGLAHAVKRDSQVVLLTQNRSEVPFDLRLLRCYEYKLGRHGFSPSVEAFADILRQVLKEDELAQATEKDNIQRTLNPQARRLIKDNQNRNFLSLDEAIYNPISDRDMKVALPLWQGLADLLRNHLVEYGHDDSSKQEGYMWTAKARKVFGIGA
jgi:hypothetical protein